MTDCCIFTIEHAKARRIYIRGVADITEPIDEFENIIRFYNGPELKRELPPNPYESGGEDYRLFEELLEMIRTQFEEIGEELIFADEKERFLDYMDYDWNLTVQKVRT